MTWAIPSEAPSAPSPKRGVCVRGLSAEDFAALAPGVSWWYNWHFEPAVGFAFAEPGFVPMLWSDHPDLLVGFRGYVRQSHPGVAFVINEPNLKGQAFMTPAAVAAAIRRARRIVGPSGIRLVGPHMAIGTAPDASVRAPDPVTGKEVVYTYMIPYLDAVKRALGDEDLPELGLHVYGNLGELKWAVGELARRYGKPVWVTEFNQSASADAKAQADYLAQAVDFLERSPDAAGYAWFMARMDSVTGSLLEKEPGKLTALGRLYVGLPSTTSAIDTR